MSEAATEDRRGHHERAAAPPLRLPAPSSCDRDEIAAALPAYDLGEELGRGACGDVVEGRHRRLGRTAAIKHLSRAFAADTAIHARFVAEAQTLASFDHPHIVPIYDFVQAGGVNLLVMECMRGGTVRDRFERTGVSMHDAVAIGISTAIALQYAHDRGVLHRDIKPENLLFSEHGVVKVSDFGMAKVQGAATNLTRTGQILGTPAYVAPEQAVGGGASEASDVYSLGIVIYELLAGDLPCEDDGSLTTMIQQVEATPRPLRDLAPHVPAALAAVVMRAIEKDPARRYASAHDLAAALDAASVAAWGEDWYLLSDVTVTLSSTVTRRLRHVGQIRSIRRLPTGARRPVVSRRTTSTPRAS